MPHSSLTAAMTRKVRSRAQGGAPAVPAIVSATPQIDDRGGTITITIENMTPSWTISAAPALSGGPVSASAYQKNSETEAQGTWTSANSGAQTLSLFTSDGELTIPYTVS